MSEYVIQTTGLTKQFGSITAVDQLSLSVPRHSIVGFLGPNGAGKSTTIKLLLGLIKPTSGEGTVFGKDIRTQNTSIRQRLGYLAQHPSFYPNLTARETLRFVARFFYTDEALIEYRIDESLDLVGLKNKADRVIKSFSGGEMQRLGIAQAYINHPDLLILDEPAAALDPMGRADVLDIMTELRQTSTIFFSTHILDDVQRVSDRVVILNHGKLVTEGPIEELLLGDDGVWYDVQLIGADDRSKETLQEQPWVVNVEELAVEETRHWRVAVSDDQAAQQHLLRLLLAQESVRVIHFGRQTYELEDVFMKLVEDD
ncbi:MAG: ABC transporter ATP-binding protein [Anaerolineales bacterium]|jgi:ABC-2 type transport system ATP-binding protein